MAAGVHITFAGTHRGRGMRASGRLILLLLPMPPLPLLHVHGHGTLRSYTNNSGPQPRQFQAASSGSSRIDSPIVRSVWRWRCRFCRGSLLSAAAAGGGYRSYRANSPLSSTTGPWPNYSFSSPLHTFRLFPLPHYHHSYSYSS